MKHRPLSIRHIVHGQRMTLLWGQWVPTAHLLVFPLGQQRSWLGLQFPKSTGGWVGRAEPQEQMWSQGNSEAQDWIKAASGRRANPEDPREKAESQTRTNSVQLWQAGWNGLFRWQSCLGSLQQPTGDGGWDGTFWRTPGPSPIRQC